MARGFRLEEPLAAEDLLEVARRAEREIPGLVGEERPTGGDRGGV